MVVRTVVENLEHLLVQNSVQCSNTGLWANCFRLSNNKYVLGAIAIGWRVLDIRLMSLLEVDVPTVVLLSLTDEPVHTNTYMYSVTSRYTSL